MSLHDSHNTIDDDDDSEFVHIPTTQATVITNGGVEIDIIESSQEQQQEQEEEEEEQIEEEEEEDVENLEEEEEEQEEKWHEWFFSCVMVCLKQIIHYCHDLYDNLFYDPIASERGGKYSSVVVIARNCPQVVMKNRGRRHSDGDVTLFNKNA